MIPQEKSAAVTRALRTAFGVAEPEEIYPITKGRTTSLVFRIVVRGASFLLKIILRTDDATRHYACMNTAAEAGIAPRVWYTSAEDRVCVTDFIQEERFHLTEALLLIPALLRRLHGLPRFATVPDNRNTSFLFLLKKDPAVDAFVQRFQAADLLPRRESEQVLALYRQMAAAYPAIDADMVSSHNDLFKPDNILFDGKRVWLVDWEAAFLNDRYFDLAVAANLVVFTDADEGVYLQQYFGEPPDMYRVARFLLARQMAHLFYAMIFLFQGALAKPIDWSEDVPDSVDFHRRMWAGDVDLANSAAKTAYGRVNLEQLLNNARRPRFQEALRLLADRHA